MTDQPHTTTRRKAGGANLALTAAICAVFVVGMVGMSFAAVPLYKIFCQVTGYGGTTQQASEAPNAAIERVMRVRFDANISNGLGWSFRPLQREVRLKVGEVTEVAFYAENRGPERTTGTASFNVTPLDAGLYFNKLACFCFSEQSLDPGERVEMPVVFFIDPEIVNDRNLDVVDTITLSYTFYPTDEPAPVKPVAATTAPASGNSL